MDEEWNSDNIQFSPIVIKFGDLLTKASKDSGELDMEFLPAEFRGWPHDPDPYTIFFKRKGREFWVLDYKNPRVALYRIGRGNIKMKILARKLKKSLLFTTGLSLTLYLLQ